MTPTPPMKLFILLLAGVMLVGCKFQPPPEMSNTEIIKETKFCEDNGLKAVEGWNGGGGVKKIICLPK